MIIPILMLLIGLVLLIQGADWLVRGASGMAERLGVSDLLIGLTIVALGTSLPEMVVTIVSVWKGSTDLAIGNVLGSNIANILLILGLTAIVFPVAATRNTVWKEIPFCLVAAILLGIQANDGPLEGTGDSGTLSRIDGIVMLTFLTIFLYYLFEAVRTETGRAIDIDRRPAQWRKLAILSVAGVAGLTIGGHWTVSAAIELARTFHISDKLIGLTVIAIGTSLPELATSFVAALRRNSAIILGNVVGSNILNVFLVLGIGSLITPLPFEADSNLDIGVVLAATAVLFLSMFIGIPNRQIGRRQGIAFVTAYAVYIVFISIRG